MVESSLKEHTRISQQQGTQLGLETMKNRNERVSPFLCPYEKQENLDAICICGKVLFENTFRKPTSKDYMLYESNCVSSGKDKTMEIVKRSMVGRG